MAALPYRQPLELGSAVLGDDDVDLVAGRGDVRAGRELGHEAGVRNAVALERRRQGRSATIGQFESDAGDEVLGATGSH